MKNKIWSLLLSLVLAMGLWMYVITTVSPNSQEEISDVPVVFDGESWLLENRNLMITGGMDTTVDLKLSGNRSDLNKLNRSNITLKADLTRVYEAGETSLTYTPVWPNDVPSGAITIESRNPSEIKLKVEKRLIQPVPVNVVFEGAVPEGFIADTENTTPSISPALPPRWNRSSRHVLKCRWRTVPNPSARASDLSSVTKREIPWKWSRSRPMWQKSIWM